MHKELAENASCGVIRLLCNESLWLWNSIIMSVHNEWLFHDKRKKFQLNPHIFR